MNEKIIFMYAGLQLTSFRCSWGFWKYIRCLMPKYNIKGNFSFQMWSYYIAWWPYMNKPLKNSYKNGSHIMHWYTVITKALKYWRQCLNKVQCMRNVYFACKICVNSIRRFQCINFLAIFQRKSCANKMTASYYWPFENNRFILLQIYIKFLELCVQSRNVTLRSRWIKY